MKKLIIIAGALALSACVSHNFSEGERTAYRCAGDKEFSLREIAGAVEVYAGGQTNRLMPGADGSYSNGAVTLLTGGGQTALTGVTGGPYENCRRAGWLPRFW